MQSLNNSPELGGALPSQRYDDSDVTVIVIGVRRSAPDKFQGLAEMRAAFPAATFVLSTSRAEAKGGGDLSQFDRVLIQEGPGLISSDKFDQGSSEVNQVRAYAQAALAECRTRLAIMLKPGGFLFSQKALQLWLSWSELQAKSATSTSRLLISKFFTINPRYDERLAFQVSTAFQLGRVSDLADFWSGPEYDFKTATWYEERPHAPASTPRERAFRGRYTPDQWMTLNYLYKDGRFPIDFHNDISGSALQEYEQALAQRFIVAHPRDFDFHDPETIDLYFNTYVNMVCYSYWEWSRWAEAEAGQAVDFPTHRFWPREDWQRKAMLFARNRIKRELFKLPVAPKKLIRQIYD